MLSRRLITVMVVILAHSVFTAHALLTSITLTSPVGGEYLRATQAITWTSTNDGTDDTVNVLYCRGAACTTSTFTTIASGIANTGTYNLVTNSLTAGTDYKIRVEASSDPVGMGSVSGATFTIDNTKPTFFSNAITSSNSSTTLAKVGDTVTLSFTTSEAVSGTPVVTVIGNSATTVTNVSGNNWTATYVLQASDTEGRVTFTISATDLAGNVSNSLFFTTNGSRVTFDRTPPTVTISMATSTFIIGQSSLTTFTFSEPVTGLTLATTTPSGVLSTPVSVDGGTTWTATYTPSMNQESSTTVFGLSLANVSDRSGNSGVGVTNSPMHVVDTLRPTVVVSLANYTLGIDQSTLVTFTFSEKVTGFASATTTAKNGTLTIATTTDGGLVWTAIFTPAPMIFDANNTIVTDLSNVYDLVLNSGTSTATSPNYVVNSIPVIFSGGGGSVSGGGGGGGGSGSISFSSPQSTTLAVTNTNTQPSSPTQQTGMLSTGEVGNGEQVLGVSVFTFFKNLKLKSTGKDVLELQKMLISEGYMTAKATGYFGIVTKTALMKWQKGHNVLQTGNFGPLSRAAANKRVL